ncbi:hypothetical protein [Erwinia mallotivora]|nr:hypothetical protein [Erwinia mallotivora]
MDYSVARDKNVTYVTIRQYLSQGLRPAIPSRLGCLDERLPSGPVKVDKW